jgi:hypothetical protein
MNKNVADAVNEVILNTNYTIENNIKVTLCCNEDEASLLTLKDEHGEMSNFFVDYDRDIIQKVRSFWGSFLGMRSKQMLRNMKD